MRQQCSRAAAVGVVFAGTLESGKLEMLQEACQLFYGYRLNFFFPQIHAAWVYKGHQMNFGQNSIQYALQNLRDI